MKTLPPVLIGLVAGFLAFQVIVLVNWPLVLTIALAVFLGLTLFTAAIIGEYEFRKYLDSCREAKTPVNANAGQGEQVAHAAITDDGAVATDATKPCNKETETFCSDGCPCKLVDILHMTHKMTGLQLENEELRAKLSRSHLRRGKRGRFISRSPKNHVQ